MKLLDCSEAWVYKAADTGRLPCVRIPCFSKTGEITKYMKRFKKEDVQKFIDKHTEGYEAFAQAVADCTPE